MNLKPKLLGNDFTNGILEMCSGEKHIISFLAFSTYAYKTAPMKKCLDKCI